LYPFQRPIKYCPEAEAILDIKFGLTLKLISPIFLIPLHHHER
jgi:hypothetical protein